MGELNLDPNVNDGATPIDILIERIMTHEQYNAQRVLNDIALLKLKSAVGFTGKLKKYQLTTFGTLLKLYIIFII